MQSKHLLRVLTQTSMDTNQRQLEELRPLQHHGHHLPEVNEFDDPEDIFPELEDIFSEIEMINAHTEHREPDYNQPLGWDSYYSYESGLVIDLDQTFVTNFCNTTPGATTEQWIIYFRELCMIYTRPRKAVRIWFAKFEPFCNQEKIRQLTLSIDTKIHVETLWTRHTSKLINPSCKFDFTLSTITKGGMPVNKNIFRCSYVKCTHADKYAKSRWDLGVVYGGALEIWRTTKNFDAAVSQFNVATNSLNQDVLQKYTKPMLLMTPEERVVYTIPLAVRDQQHRREPRKKCNYQRLLINYTDCTRFSEDEYPLEIREHISAIKSYLREPGNSLETMRNTRETRHLYNVVSDYIRKEKEQSIIFHGDCIISPYGFDNFLLSLDRLFEIQNRQIYAIETTESLQLPTIIIGEKKSRPAASFDRVLGQPIMRCPLGKCLSIDRNGIADMKQCQEPFNLSIGDNLQKLYRILDKIEHDNPVPARLHVLQTLRERIETHVAPVHGRNRKFPHCPICMTQNRAPDDVIDNFDHLKNLNDTLYVTRIQCHSCDHVYCSTCLHDHFTDNPTICRGADVSFGNDTDCGGCPSCGTGFVKDGDTCSVVQCTTCKDAFCIACMCMRSHLHPIGVPMDDIVRRHFCKIVHVYPPDRFSAEDLTSFRRREEGMWRIRDDGMIEYNIYRRHPEWNDLPNEKIARKFIRMVDDQMIRVGH